MPIEVQHGGKGTTAIGQIIAQAGQRNLDRQQQDAHLAIRLKQQRDMQMDAIEARANLQRQAADDAMARMAMSAGLDEHVREQEFEREMQAKQEEARMQASQWEYQYTAKQRQDMARLNNARQAIEANDSFSQEEKVAALKAIDLQQAGIKPSMMPRDPNKPQFPEGRGIGDQWTTESGTLLTRDSKGELKLLERYDQSQAGIEAKNKAALEEKLLDMRVKLATEKIDSVDAKGEVTGSRLRTPEEIDAIMQAATGGRMQQQQPSEQQQVLGGQQQPTQEQWWDRAKGIGLKVTESDKRLPPIVGSAQANFRQYIKKYGKREDVPPEIRPAFDEAFAILMAYREHAKGK